MAKALSLGILAFGLTAYISKQYLDHSCPTIPINQVSPLSACRHLVDRACENNADVPEPWGGDKPGLIPSWSEANSSEDMKKSRWLPSYVAVQMDVPVALLASYDTSHSSEASSKKAMSERTADGLARNLFAAFLDARSRGPDGWLIDRNVPPRSYKPGSHLFGDTTGLSAFMFDSWSSRSKYSIQPFSVLPADALIPSSFLPSNEEALLVASENSSQPESAGTVFYWKFPSVVVNAFNSAASYGWPWRIMDGGWQEFVVEKISEETARVTYLSVECSDVHPGGQVAKSFKKMPWLVYEAHVLYAQSLFLRAVRQLRKAADCERN